MKGNRWGSSRGGGKRKKVSEMKEEEGVVGGCLKVEDLRTLVACSFPHTLHVFFSYSVRERGTLQVVVAAACRWDPLSSSVENKHLPVACPKYYTLQVCLSGAR